MEEEVVEMPRTSDASLPGNLKADFLVFAKKALEQAQSFVAAAGMPKRAETLFEFRAPEFSGSAAAGSTISFRQIEKPDFRGVLLVNRERWGTKEAKACAREHFEREVRRERQVLGEDWKPIRSPTFGSSGNQLGHQLAYEVHYALADLCERLQTLRPDRDQLLEAYDRLIQHWTDPTIEWRLAAPLVNFRTEKCPLRIDGEIELIALSHEEKTRLWNHNPGFGPFGEPQVMDRSDLARARFMLVGFSSGACDDHGFGPEFASKVTRVVTALRLLRAGDVGAPAILGTSSGLFEKFASQYVFDGRVRNSGRVFELRACDWEDFGRIYGALGGLANAMQIPLRRFNQAFGRPSAEDMIIDLTIALESCLLSNSGAKKVPLSKRGAALLVHLRNPAETESLLRAMYEVRNEIVHEGKLLCDEGLPKKVERLSPVVAKDFLHACEDVTRDVLRECVLRLAAGGSVVDMCRELDAQMLSSLSLSPRACPG